MASKNTRREPGVLPEMPYNCKGHYSNQCFSKTVTAATNELNLDTAFLGSVRANPEFFWTTMVLLDKVKVSFKLDTGVEVAAILEETYRALGNETLQEPSKV